MILNPKIIESYWFRPEINLEQSREMLNLIKNNSQSDRPLSPFWLADKIHQNTGIGISLTLTNHLVLASESLTAQSLMQNFPVLIENETLRRFDSQYKSQLAEDTDYWHRHGGRLIDPQLDGNHLGRVLQRMTMGLEIVDQDCSDLKMEQLNNLGNYYQNAGLVKLCHHLAVTLKFIPYISEIFEILRIAKIDLILDWHLPGIPYYRYQYFLTYPIPGWDHFYGASGFKRFSKFIFFESDPIKAYATGNALIQDLNQKEAWQVLDWPKIDAH